MLALQEVPGGLGWMPLGEPAGIPAAEAAGWGAAAVQMLHSSLRRNSCPLVSAAPLLLSLCRAHLDGSPTMWGLEVKIVGVRMLNHPSQICRSGLSGAGAFSPSLGLFSLSLSCLLGRSGYLLLPLY